LSDAAINDTRVAALAGTVTPLWEGAITALAAAGFRVVQIEDGAAPDEVFPSIAAELGPVTCLVNSAGEPGRDTALTTSKTLLGHHLAAAVIRPALLAQSFAEALPAGRSGLILNLVSHPLDETEPFSAMVGQSALRELTTRLAQALAPRIRVNLIAPGPVLPALPPVAASPEEVWERVGEAVRYLLGAEAVTGQVIALDLGRILDP
jgi:NAD(P)-dependent dehydrogenase (short-subunit alcohol dehydrogenase family)